jgi:hypothetical protein
MKRFTYKLELFQIIILDYFGELLGIHLQGVRKPTKAMMVSPRPGIELDTSQTHYRGDSVVCMFILLFSQ